MTKGRVRALLALAIFFHGAAFAKPCVRDDARGITLTGTVYEIAERRAPMRFSHWILKLAEPLCIARALDEAPQVVREVQLVFGPGSPYYEIYHGLVARHSSFRVTGAISHVAVAYPVRAVLFEVDDLVPRSVPARPPAPARRARAGRGTR